MNLVGGKAAKLEMAPQHKPVFEEGVALAFGRWTALQLGVVNEWGGPSSREKAQALLEDTIDWFYQHKGKDHEYLDLEDLFDEALQVDFNIQAEDDSPYQMARNLVNLYSQVAAGDYSYVEALRQLPNANTAAACQRDPAQQGGEEESSSEGDDEDMEGQEGQDMEMDDAPPPGVPLQQQQQEPEQRQQPVVDEDGFQVVQRKGRGTRR
ncbi:hypothetical protein N2152v2_003024 [Parachlorella kessleri]